LSLFISKHLRQTYVRQKDVDLRNTTLMVWLHNDYTIRWRYGQSLIARMRLILQLALPGITLLH